MTNGIRRAFVVGSNGPPTMNPLTFAASDADHMRAALRTQPCGFQVAGDGERWTASGLRDALFQAAEECAPDDTFLMFFAGHGKQASRGGLFLLLDDSDGSHLLGTALLVSHVVDAMRQCRATNKLLILDCCHAGEAARHGGIRGDETPYSLKDVVDGENFQALMAGDHLDRARELASLGGGFLTAHIRDGLTTKRFDATGGSGVVTLARLSEWLDVKWQEHQQRFPADEIPRPMLAGTARGPLYLTVAPRWTPYPVPLPKPLGTITVLPMARAPNGNAYCIGTTPVTNGQYRELLEDRAPAGARWDSQSGDGGWTPFEPWTDPRFSGDTQPVTCVSLRDAVRYTQRLALRLPANWKTGLPSPTMWNFAAFGTEHPILIPRAWNAATPTTIDARRAADRPAPVAGGDLADRTNGFGIVDPIGNVWEWCAASWDRDRWDDFSTKFLICDTVHEDADRRITCEIRGGSYLDDLAYAPIVLQEQQLRDRRKTRHANVGFRIAVSVPAAHLPADVVERVDDCAPIDRM